MNDLRFASSLKMALVLGTVVSCLSALCSPALAIAIYDAFADVSVSAPGPIPSGTGLSLFTGSTFTPPPIEIGNGIATNAAFAAPPGTASALVLGSATAPPDSFAASFASAISQGALLNQNAGTVSFPLTVSHSSIVNASATGPNESADAHFLFQVLFDGAVVRADEGRCTVLSGSCTRGDTDSISLALALTPGFHSLFITAQADGFATAATPPNPVPEPTTLLLVGTTAAGLGLARWRQRRRRQQQP
jgi:hypothetical protein